jgi:hypothetical protein
LNFDSDIWSNGYFVTSLAIASISLLVASAWLFIKYRKQRRMTGWLYLLASIILHLGLILWLPNLYQSSVNNSTNPQQLSQDSDHSPVQFSTFIPDREAVSSSALAQSNLSPLPVNDLNHLTKEPDPFPSEPNLASTEQETTQPEITEPTTEPPIETESEPLSSLTANAMASLPELGSEFDSLLEDAFSGLDAIDPETLTEETVASTDAEPTADQLESDPTTEENTAASENDPKLVEDDAAIMTDETADGSTPSAPIDSADVATVATPFDKPEGTVLGAEQNDFANRNGEAKSLALHGTGGNDESEAAVQRALEYLVRMQRDDGAWDPRTTQAGLERSPLGTSRGSAGSQAESALTGLALLSLMGAGHTHQAGQYSDSVYRGLAFLIRQQKPNGSMAGPANVYEATYCHGMAALAMCEAAAITKDASAILSAQRAIAYTQMLQHPSTGGWRYTEGDPGDLSQLGWQAMVLDAGNRAGVNISPTATIGVQRFLRSVESGNAGGLASYRPGEAPSRTMTAESLATRLLIGDAVSVQSIQESERYIMQQVPGVGQDNYYYWYYATIALHQLQNENWSRWNQALQNRLLTTQRNDGSWPTDTLWGGYGGTIYTTAMATLCLETYYRHGIRENKSRIAQQPFSPLRR